MKCLHEALLVSFLTRRLLDSGGCVYACVRVLRRRARRRPLDAAWVAGDADLSVRSARPLRTRGESDPTSVDCVPQLLPRCCRAAVASGGLAKCSTANCNSVSEAPSACPRLPLLPSTLDAPTQPQCSTPCLRMPTPASTWSTSWAARPQAFTLGLRIRLPLPTRSFIGIFCPLLRDNSPCVLLMPLLPYP